MTDSRRATSRPFTLVLCTKCQSSLGQAMLEQLRSTVRHTRHGVLVTTGCVLGEFTCLARQQGGDSVLILQPCSIDRAAEGPAIWIGAINSLDDLRIVCTWLRSGRWESNPLPDRFHLALPPSPRTVASN